MADRDALIKGFLRRNAGGRKPPRRGKVPEDFQVYDLPKGASRRGARYYSKGGVRPGDRSRPD